MLESMFQVPVDLGVYEGHPVSLAHWETQDWLDLGDN